MSENLSIDEIIKRAEKIKHEAEEQLKSAEKSLDEKAKTAIEEVVVDENKVVERISQRYDSAKQSDDEDVKEYTPKKKSKSAFKTKILELNNEDKVKTPAPDKDFKTRKIDIKGDGDDSDMKIVDLKKTGNQSEAKKARHNPFKRERAGSMEQTKPVAFVSKPERVEKSDLETIPTIVAREQVFDDDNGNYDEEIGVQITFDGFDDIMESVPTIDEDVAEQILEQRRQEKVGKFRLFGPDETDKELGNNSNIKEDYVSKGEREHFISSLLSKRKAVQTRLIITLALGLPLLFLTMFTNSVYFPALLAPPGMAYFITAFVFYFVIMAVNINVIIHGFKVKKGVNSDFPIALTSVLILAHTGFMIFNEDLWYENHLLLVSVGVLALFMSQLGKREMMQRIIDNFDFITTDGNCYTVENITNNVDAEIICRGFIEESPLIKTSVKTDFTTNFLEIECKSEPADKISATIYSVMLVANIILFVAMFFINGVETAVNMALCGLCVSLPTASLLVSNMVLNDVSSTLDRYGSRVCGYEGAMMADSGNVMVMEAADLFGKHSCDIHGIKTFYDAKIDDAIIQAAAVIIQTNSPLAHAFDDVIIGKQSILPKVEDVTYEDKMGTSAWIYRRKVLVGNRDLLNRHGVAVPPESFEAKYTVKGRKALYLAVGGRIVAMFVVSYSADSDLKRQLKKLEKSGITIIVKSCDPYINEESISDLFGLPKGFIRVMNYSAARVYDKYSNQTVEKSPAYVVHNGTALGFVSAMHGAEVIISTRKMVSFLVFFGSILGFGVVALLSAMGAFAQLTAFSIIAFQLVWAGFTVIISKLKGIGF